MLVPRNRPNTTHLYLYAMAVKLLLKSTGGKRSQCELDEAGAATK